MASFITLVIVVVVIACLITRCKRKRNSEVKKPIYRGENEVLVNCTTPKPHRIEMVAVISNVYEDQTSFENPNSSFTECRESPEKLTFKCNQCSKAFASDRGLQQHIRLSHT